MDPQEEIKRLKDSLQQAENVQAELDLRVFNLKTLYDVSNDIYGSVESETIIRNFLLMTMGNFGVMQGFILLLDDPSKDNNRFVSVGFPDDLNQPLEDGAIQLLGQADWEATSAKSNPSNHRPFLPPEV